MSATENPRSPLITTDTSRTMADLVSRAVERYGDRVALMAKREGDWSEVSYAEVGTIVCELAIGLLKLGLNRGDRVAILGSTRPEWSYVDLAVSTAGGVVVPIYPSNSPDECEWVLGNSEAKIVVCENSRQLAKITRVRDRLPALEEVIVIDPDPDGTGAIALEGLREQGRGGDANELSKRTAAVSDEDAYTIIYTSGTTGPPKGCVLSHRNYRAFLDSVNERGVFRADDLIYLFVPLAHTFALTLQLIAFDLGATLAYFGGDPAKIMQEVQEVRPTYFPSVPRIFEKIYALSAPTIAAEVGEQRLGEMVAMGVTVRDLESAGEEVPTELRGPWATIDEQVFARVRGIFGGRIREAATGAAPIDKQVLEFFYAAGIPMLEGYGMTETASGISMSTRTDFKFGSVGRPLPGIAVRIANDGEILVRGGNVFEGYYRNEQATAETLAGGWLHTGDLGSIDADGYLWISGRKKDIIITAGGKNLTPSNLENDLKKCRYISQAVMHGDRRPFPTMLITLDRDETLAWANNNGKTQDITTLANDPDVLALIQSELDNANANYAQVAQVKKFFILDHDLSQETGELTPTLKVKRGVVNEKYRAQFDALYNQRSKPTACTAPSQMSG
jgi:long-chain acyl-CoA synthetase